jgi:hypothetical protein
MKSAAVAKLESLLETRKLGRTLLKSEEADPAARLVPSGVATVDAALAGGWRRGEVSELVGGRSSGRTRVVLSTLATVTARGELAALVDAVDRFDPRTAAAAGLDLNRVLWVRGRSLSVESARPALIDHAVRQALRACDLIVRAGGFSVVVLDVADVPARALRALPFTTWLRLAHVNEGRETVCLLVGQTPMGSSARGASIAIDATSHWTGQSAQSRRLSGLDVRARPRVPLRHARCGAPA